MSVPPILEPDRCVLAIIDYQEKLLPFIPEAERMLSAAKMLLKAAPILNIPVAATEQNPRGLGRNRGDIVELVRAAGGAIHDKETFSSWGCAAFADRMRETDRDQALVCGIEAHICVQQTALDLVRHGYQAIVCADAVGSRGALDCSMALDRMRQAGVVVTTVESVIYELMGRSGTPQFRRILEIIKSGGSDAGV